MTSLNNRPPRVFISYAREDGESFARDLREKLEALDIPTWLDRFGLEGGRDWWLQIQEALNKAEYLVLVMTPAAMLSANVRKEWHYARQRGVCVYPVMVDSVYEGEAFKTLPKWMRDVHFYNTARQWDKFIHDLNQSCGVPRVPFMVEELPRDYVARLSETEQVLGLLLDENCEEPRAVTVGLRGAGGFGKTTLAKAICHDERVQQAFDDGILWVTLGEQPGDLTGRVEDLIYILSGERPGFTGLDAATASLVELLAERDILLVIDDVWNAAHMRPFMQGGPRCARLMTTRNDASLPNHAQRIEIEGMRRDEAVRLLTIGVAGLDEPEKFSAEQRLALRELSEQLGEWPLLLRLANGVLRERVNKHRQALPDALAYVEKALQRHGLTAFDTRQPEDRGQAVAKTLNVSLELLREVEYDHFRELVIFPEDTDIPLGTVSRLWGATGGLDDFDTEALCERLYQLSLLSSFDLTTHRIRLHDVFRGYLRTEQGTELATIHAQLLESYAAGAWADLPPDEPYLWDTLVYHLEQAGYIEELLATVQDAPYLASKTTVRGAYAAESDLLAALILAPDDALLQQYRLAFAQAGHILNRCRTSQEVLAALYSRIPAATLNGMLDAREMVRRVLAPPYIEAWRPLPDLPPVALSRTLAGHSDWVRGCTLTPDGRMIVSVSSDGTVRVWDAEDGVERLNLIGHGGPVNACAVSADGRVIVSCDDEGLLFVWDGETGEQKTVLRGHAGRVWDCAISADGRLIVSASDDKTVRVWDAQTGETRFVLSGHARHVNGCAVSADGRTVVSASSDGTVRVWDGETGESRFVLRGHDDRVRACAISSDGRWIVSAGWDRVVRVWDAEQGVGTAVLRGHTDTVRGCGISADGRVIASAGADGTVRVWDREEAMATGADVAALRSHKMWVNGCALSSDGHLVVSASDDRTLKLWDTAGISRSALPTGHTGQVWCCAASDDGRLIVTSAADETVRLWDTASGSELMVLRAHSDWVWGCAVSADSRTVVSASSDNTVRVWDGETGGERLSLRGHTGRVWDCAVSADGRVAASSSDDNTLRVWNTDTGEERLTLRGHTGRVWSCDLSADGRWLASASNDKTARLWDALDGSEKLLLTGHSDAVVSAVLSADARLLVTASWDKTLCLWDIDPEAGSAVERRRFAGHLDAVWDGDLSKDGRWIVSASRDNSLKVWDANTGECQATLYVDGHLSACAWLPDSEHIIAAGSGGVYFLRFVSR